MRGSFFMGVAIVSGTLVLSGTAPFAAAQSSLDPSASVDQLLEFTLTNLRERLQEAVYSNERLAGRNNLLRNQVMDLQDDLRELQNGKIVLLETANSFAASIKLSEQESALRQQKTADLKSRKQILDQEQSALRQRVDAMTSEESPVRDEVKALNAEIQDLQRKFQDPVPVVGGAFQKDKKELEKLLAQSQAAQKSNRQRVEAMQGELRKLGEERRKAQDLRAQLKVKREEYQKEFEKARAQGKSLASGGAEVTAEKKAQIKIASDEIEQLQQKRQYLTQAIQGIEKGNLLPEVEKEQRVQMLRWRDTLLAQQKQLQGRKGKRLEEKVVDSAASKGDTTASAGISGQQGLIRLQETRSGLQVQLAHARQVQQDFPDLERKLSGEIKEARRRLAELQSSKSGKKNRAVLDREAKKTQASIQRQIMISQNDVRSLDSALVKARKELAQAQDRNRTMNAEREGLEAGVQKLLSDAGSLQVEIDRVMSSGQSQIKGLQQEVEGLRLRKTALSASFELVNAKYREIDSDRDTMENQQKLQEYLTVLRRENSSLKDKLLNLRVSGVKNRITNESFQSPVQDNP